MTNIHDKLDFWIKNNLNVLLVGGHGIGKTSIIQSAVERNNISWRYFSGATMDPWVDFIGVPKEHKNEDGSSHLEMIRPLEFQNDQIEFLFFDEFNRAPAKVRNAVMELIQFKSINGYKLNNLKMVWAAINPYDENETYDVDQLDPAQQDRFHVIYDLPTTPDTQYFTDTFGTHIGKRAINWWNQLPPNINSLVSPRRLQYAVEYYMLGGDLNDILDRNTRPDSLKTSLQLLDDKTTHMEEWLKDSDSYIEQVADRTTSIDVVSAFTDLREISTDQAVTYINHLPACHINSLALDHNTVGILMRYVKLYPDGRKNRMIMSAVKQIKLPTASSGSGVVNDIYVSKNVFNFLSHSSFASLNTNMNVLVSEHNHLPKIYSYQYLLNLWNSRVDLNQPDNRKVVQCILREVDEQYRDHMIFILSVNPTYLTEIGFGYSYN